MATENLQSKVTKWIQSDLRMKEKSKSETNKMKQEAANFNHNF